MFAPISVGDGALDVPQNNTFAIDQTPNSASSCGVTQSVTTVVELSVKERKRAEQKATERREVGISDG